MSEVLARLTAALSDRYRIERELGAGGMATVYLAHDIKHDRDVAIKVLHPDLGAALGGDRFLSEIRTTARLQHPHILPLLDSGDADGLLYYVMPLVTGETLRARLEREQQLPVEDAIRIAREVADALGYAHGLGVVHRDIKPENILLQGGHALVADFGIALAVQTAGGTRMTQTGLSLGTPQYMSPEQAMGEKMIDARSDLYALGAVTYEMLVGEAPFTGPSVQAIVARLITEEPRSIAAQRKAVPAGVESAVLRALEKLPADRYATATEFAAALTSQGRDERRETRDAKRYPSSLVSRLSSPLFLAVLGIVALWGWLRPRPAAEVSRQRVSLWQHSIASLLSPGAERAVTRATIAPDGSSIVFVDSVSGTLQLMRKLRNEGAATPIIGTEHAVSPFFSPDGKWIGYVTTDSKLRKVAVEGGGSITLADNVNPIYTTAAWLDDNTIVYVGGGGSGGYMRRISANGGASAPVMPDSAVGGQSILSLAPLPGSRGVLFTACPGNCAIESAVRVVDLVTGTSRVLVPNVAGAWFSPTGHLLYTDRNGGLYAMGFDPKRLVTTSESVPVVDGVVPGSFTLSQTGVALYAIGTGPRAPAELLWVARDGKATPFDSGWKGDFGYPALSPDGKALAVSVTDGATHLWIRRSDGTRQKLTQDGTVNWRPSWSADGKSVLFSSNRRGVGGQNGYDLYQMPVDGSAPPTLLQQHGFGIWEGEFSRDGQWLVIRTDEGGGDANIRARRLSGDTALVPIAVDKSITMQVALSPDGHWLAYTGNATGRNEIYVTPFPAATSPRLVSRDGGAEPRWAHGGRELFFKGAGQLMAVDVTPGPTLTIGTPRPLFSLTGYRFARNRPQYDVTPDDKRFVMIKDLGQNAVGDVVYVENWFKELLAKVKR
jgi:serine/threonine protein kinase/Tol biopolymer transport system component